MNQTDPRGCTNVVSKAIRHYDDGDRCWKIEHKKADDTLLLRITYVYNRDNTVGTRTEYDATGQTAHTALVTFGYDARKRLTSEARVLDGSTYVYAFTYSYDQLGNRRTKTDTLTGGNLTGYVYDTDWDPVTSEWKPNLPYTPTWTPEPYVTRNNRLLEYKVYGPEGSGGRPVLRTVHYTYYATGHASNITIKDEWTGTGDPPAEYARYHDLALYYGSAGSLWLAVNDSWTLDEQEQPVDYQVTGAREFRYDGSGQRYMTRPWNTPTPDPFDVNYPWTPDESAVWTDSVGGLPFGDFEAHLDGNGYPVTAEAMRFLAGGGLHAQQTVGGDNPIRYFHGNLGGSTMMLTDEGGDTVVSPVVSYTAFGEPVGDFGALDTRYLNGGAFGVESGFMLVGGANANLAPITLQNEGGQWYEPDIGRLVQALPDRGALDTNPYALLMPIGPIEKGGLIGWMAGRRGGMWIPGPGNMAGILITWRTAKGIVAEGQRATKNAIAGWLIRHGPGGWGNAFRSVAPALGLCARLIDYLWLLEIPGDVPVRESQPMSPEELEELLRRYQAEHPESGSPAEVE